MTDNQQIKNAFVEFLEQVRDGAAFEGARAGAE